MANLEITHSTNRIRIRLWGGRIQIYKARELTNPQGGLAEPCEPSIYTVGSSEIVWTSEPDATPAVARNFANWLTVAAGLADDLDRLIVSEADFGRVVVEGWPIRPGAYAPEKIEMGTWEGQIHIVYPAAWVE